jgi:hypothetical protein
VRRREQRGESREKEEVKIKSKKQNGMRIKLSRRD